MAFIAISVWIWNPREQSLNTKHVWRELIRNSWPAHHFATQQPYVWHGWGFVELDSSPKIVIKLKRKTKISHNQKNKHKNYLLSSCAANNTKLLGRGSAPGRIIGSRKKCHRSHHIGIFGRPLLGFSESGFSLMVWNVGLRTRLNWGAA